VLRDDGFMGTDQLPTSRYQRALDGAGLRLSRKEAIDGLRAISSAAPAPGGVSYTSLVYGLRRSGSWRRIDFYDLKGER
jgi:hypothetical protein